MRLSLLRQRARAGTKALGQRGQATLEYILLLVIIVIVILSLCYQFNDSFRIYAEAFFDGYVRCLLEVGELPGTGSVCAQSFTAYNPKAGKSLLKDNLPSGGGSGGKGGAAAAAAAAAAKAKAGGGETRGAGGGQVVGRFGRDLKPTSSVAGKMAGGSGSSGGGSPDMIGMSNTIPMNRSRGYEKGDRAVMQTYEAGEEGPTEEQKKASATVAKKSASGESNLTASRVAENLQRKPAGNGDKDSGSFTISGLIRLIFIILIIVALVLLVGGQLMQIARAGDKGGGD